MKKEDEKNMNIDDIYCKNCRNLYNDNQNDNVRNLDIISNNNNINNNNINNNSNIITNIKNNSNNIVQNNNDNVYVKYMLNERK